MLSSVTLKCTGWTKKRTVCKFLTRVCDNTERRYIYQKLDLSGHFEAWKDMERGRKGGKRKEKKGTEGRGENDLGPPSRRSAIPGYYCYNNPNPNPNPNPRTPGMADLRNGGPLPEKILPEINLWLRPCAEA